MRRNLVRVEVLGSVESVSEIESRPCGSKIVCFSLSDKRLRVFKKNVDDSSYWYFMAIPKDFITEGLLAEFVGKSVDKGDRIFVEGTIKDRYLGDNNKPASTQIRVEGLTILHKTLSSRDGEAVFPPSADDDEEDDLPF